MGVGYRFASWAAVAASLAASVATSLAVSGCAHVPAATLYKLWTFDMATADPSAIRAAIRYPKVLAPRAGGAKLTLTQADPKGAAPRTHAFVLEELEEGAALDRFRRQGYPVRAFRLSAADTAKVRAIQVEMNATPGQSGSFGVSIDACRLGPLPQGALLSSTYLKLDAREPYMPVVEDIDLRKEIGEAALAAQVPPCTGS